MDLTIHSTNVTGLGACEVVLSFLKALDGMQVPFRKIICYVPAYGPVSEFTPVSKKIEIRKMSRRLPKTVSRVFECFFPEQYFDLGDSVIVLGDVPLRTRIPQVILVHQAHLHRPAVNPHVRDDIVFRMMRFLTDRNSRFVKTAFVQTEAMGSGLKASYPNWAKRNCIKVVGQPAPRWFEERSRSNTHASVADGLSLFYPAADYPHKNHRIFEKLLKRHMAPAIRELVLTVSVDKFAQRSDWLKCVGHLNHEACLMQYAVADALVFPSVLESYGLPLVEAMTIGLPILAADLPYAKVLCGEEAIYFDPDSAESLYQGCEELQRRLLAGWTPDWSKQLAGLPKDWNEVVEAFLEELK